MRVTYVTAGAAGMICGSCLRDNALTHELRAIGCDVMLVPVYTPIRTDVENASEHELLFGGVSVYLEQKSKLFRKLPRFLTSWLDRPGIIKRLTARNSIEVEAGQLGELTLSMLRGENGNQRREVKRCIAWVGQQARPDLVNLSNLLIAGFVPALKRALNVPVLVTLQGDDLFLEELTEEHRPQVLSELRRVAREVDGFITFSEFYATTMAKLLEVPMEKFHVVPLGIDCSELSLLNRVDTRPSTMGYFGRIAPEKGFDQVVDAFIRIHKEKKLNTAYFKAGGWLGENNREYFSAQENRIKAAGLKEHFEYIGSPDWQGKMDFLASIDVFSMPTAEREPKALPVLEALASGVPVVQPAHGIFPEMLDKTGGGILFSPENPASLTDCLENLISNPDRARQLGQEGREGVNKKCTAGHMASHTLDVYQQFL